MNTAQTIQAVALCVEAGQPCILWGSPGTGKTSALRALAQPLGRWFELVIASLREPADFAGLPVVMGNEVRLVPPDWAVRAAQAPKAFVFFDEITTCPPSVQAPLLRVIQEGVVGDLMLPPSVARVAAANPPEQAANGYDLTAPLANRFCHFDWSPTYDSWSRGMLGGWPPVEITMPDANWETQLPRHYGLVAGFIAAKRDALNKMPTAEAEAGKAWPSQRSWEASARLLAISVGYEQNIRAGLVEGCIGEAMYREFWEWYQHTNLPDPDECLAHPDTVMIPKRGDLVYAMFGSLQSAVLANNTEQRYRAVWRILGRACKDGMPDLAVAAGKALVTHRPPGMADFPPEVALLGPVVDVT